MNRLRIVSVLMLAALTAPAVVGESAASAYRAGVRAEAKENYDVAYQAYKIAHDKKPLDPKYMSAYLRVRFYASAAHIRRGESLRDAHQLQEALAEFRMATGIDPTNFEASQELRQTADMIQKQAIAAQRPESQKAAASALERSAEDAAGPEVLQISSNSPISIHMTSMTDIIYKTLGKLAGINVLIDPQYKPQKINVELKDVTLREAFRMVAIQSNTFWRVLSPNTILVSADTAGRRKDLETNVMMTFYLHNAATPTELQAAAANLKTILDISRMQLSPAQRSITLRGTPDQMVLAQKLLSDIDKPKPEVMIEVAVLEVTRDRLRTVGLNPPTSVTVALQPQGTANSNSGGGSNFSLNQLAHLNANDLSVSIPSTSLSMLMSDSNTKVIQRPELRAMDSEKASLKIGDRIPIATGSFQSGLTNGVNTQFQYLDVGVNIDITPYVHANNDVTLQMSLEISSVTGEQNVDGITEPTIGQRRIEHEARLADGEVNLIGGILEDTESNSLSGYPLLARIPILKYLFGQENKERQQSEIVFAITPHIVRGANITDNNMRMIDIGTSSSVTYRPRGDSGVPVNQEAAPNAAKPAPAPTVPPHAATPAVKTSPAPARS